MPGLWIALALPLALAGAPTVDEADAAFAAKDWATAAKAYRKIAKKNPDDARSWFRLGLASYALGDHEEALSAYARAFDGGHYPFIAGYNAACSAALSGDADAALNWLGKAIDAGYTNADSIRGDTDLASVREDPRFAELVEKAAKKQYPCKHDARYRQFDFWVGDWDVYDTNDNLVGTNTIARIEGDCALTEHWKGSVGGTGFSLNWVDPRDGSWHQNWVAPSGQVIVPMAGGLQDGKMVLTGEVVSGAGETETWRGTWTPLEGGHVRQLLERSPDGETWNIWFDGLYVPRGSEPPR